jgi:outer membrane protein assembly factor BamE (lipoprotein component of BamABCDE complex)
MKTSFAVAGVALLLAGCTSGTYVAKDSAAQFQVGVTTEQQVIAALGQPDATAELVNGHRDSYIHVSGGASPIDYVPLVALAVSPGFQHTTTVDFDFDAQGVLRRVNRTRELS